MINFFRKIRRQLANENQFFKYSRYAIGEIVLVVVGILIALQINNWNEDRQIKATLRLKLESLIHNLEDDKQNLNDQKEQLRFKIHALQHLLTLAGKQPVSFRNHIRDNMYIIPYKENTLYWNGPFPDTAVKSFVDRVFLESGRTFNGLSSVAYDELILSGMYSLLKNDSLNVALKTYYEMFQGEFNQKYLDVINKWRDEFKNQGAVFYNSDGLEEPLKLIIDNPRFEAGLKEIIYESVWIGHLVEERLLIIDNFLIEEIENEISKLN